MTAVTLTEYKDSAVPGMKMGSCSLANGYTSKFGFHKCEGVVITPKDGTGTAVIDTAISSGTVTIYAMLNDGPLTSGTAITTAFNCNYIAWGRGA